MSYVFTDDDLKILRDHYIDEQIAAKEEIARLTARLKEIERKLSFLGAFPDNSLFSGKLNGYDRNWNWNQKIKYVLQKNGKLSRGGIVDAILKLEPDREAERASIANSIGATLSTSVDKEFSGYSRESKDGSWIYFATKS